MRSLGYFAFALTLALAYRPAAAQDVKVIGGDRVVSVEASADIEVPPEVAILKLGYRNQAPTHKQAYSENVEAADRIIKALLAAGVPEDKIETESLDLSHQRPRPQETKEPRFEAFQQWSVRVRPSDAQEVVDAVVAAGANFVGDVVWTVEDPDQLEAKAYAAAVTKARELAQKMASALGLRLKEIVSVSNHQYMGGMLGGVAGGIPGDTVPVKLRLFPEKVRRSATVYVTFAFEPTK